MTGNSRAGWLAAVSLMMLAFCMPLGSAAMAGSATDWVRGNHASSRMVIDTADWEGRSSIMVAGIHVTLEEGWKTYWRNPGDAGLPPHFDWSGSVNLKRAQVLWPAPVRFHDSAGTSYGYKKEVVFPVLIEAKDQAKPVDLRLKIEYAVCADICIPVEANLKITSRTSGFFSRSYRALLERYLARIPVKITSGKVTGIGMANAQARLSGENPALIFDARFPNDGPGNDLFVEGPDGYYLPPAKRVSKQKDGTVRFAIDLTKGDDPKDLKGHAVIVTLVSDKAQAELTWRVD